MESKHPPPLCQWSLVPQKHRFCWCHFLSSFTLVLGKEQKPYNASSASGGCSALHQMYFSEYPFFPHFMRNFLDRPVIFLSFLHTLEKSQLLPFRCWSGDWLRRCRTWFWGLTSPRAQLTWVGIARWFEVRQWLGPGPYCIFPLTNGSNHRILRQSLKILLNFSFSVEGITPWIFHSHLFLSHLK